MDYDLRRIHAQEARARKVKRNMIIGFAAVVCIAAFAVFLGIFLSSGQETMSRTEPFTSPVTERLAVSESESDVSSAVSAEITVSLMGDCTLGTDESFDWNTSFNAYYEYQGADYFFQNVKSILDSDDLTIVNFEGTLTDSTDRQEKSFNFKGKPEFSSILSSASVEAANVANNHSHDYGEQGFTDTVSHLQRENITVFGYDQTAVIEIKEVKVGLIGISNVYEQADAAQLLQTNIEKVKSEGAQLIIVSFHWGEEREDTPDAGQISLAHLAIDLGADLVAGHHPHVLQGIENYKGKYIAYSLGNFCFGGNSSPSDMDTIIFQQTFTIEDGDVKTDENTNIIPCRISSELGYNNYQPTPAAGEESQRILDKLEERSNLIPY